MLSGEWDERGTRRIIALLLSLANLAERAAARSLPVRWLVLVLLRRAQAVVLPLVVEVAGIDPACFDDPEAGFRPVDAMLLAASLRMIATLLSACLSGSTIALTVRAPRGHAARTACSLLFHSALANPLGLPQAPWDTS